MVAALEDLWFYHFYGIGDQFEYGTEQTEILSTKVAVNASNKLNIPETSNAWQGSSTLYY